MSKYTQGLYMTVNENVQLKEYILKNS